MQRYWYHQSMINSNSIYNRRYQNFNWIYLKRSFHIYNYMSYTDKSHDEVHLKLGQVRTRYITFVQVYPDKAEFLKLFRTARFKETGGSST